SSACPVWGFPYGSIGLESLGGALPASSGKTTSKSPSLTYSLDRRDFCGNRAVCEWEMTAKVTKGKRQSQNKKMINITPCRIHHTVYGCFFE
ncbi:MAG TPA: hypothetical protein VGL13_14130, partial [Polyangiaceae bacterium]